MTCSVFVPMIRLAKFVGTPLLPWMTKSAALAPLVFRYGPNIPRSASRWFLVLMTLKFEVQDGPQRALAQVLTFAAPDV